MSARTGHSNFASPESHPRLRRLTHDDRVKTCDAFRSKSIGYRLMTGIGIGVVSFFVLPRCVWTVTKQLGVDVDSVFGARSLWTILLSLFVFWFGPLLLTLLGVFVQRRYMVNRRLAALDACVPCPTCLYSLAETTKQAVKVKCPECGTEVEIAAEIE